MFLSSLSLVELENAAALAAKQSKAAGAAWRDWIDGQLLPAFDGRVLPIDVAIARRRARYPSIRTVMRCSPRLRSNMG
jgi:hypothetical protein